MELNGELHSPAPLPLRKEFPLPNGQDAGWAPESAWLQEEREIIPSLSLLGIEPQSSSQ